jgi:hypothetical protein
MIEREFQRLMMIYGAEIGRWPSNRQADAEQWLREHSQSRSMLFRAAEMDRLLSDSAPLVDSTRVDDAIEALLPKTALVLQERRRRLSFPVFVWPQWRWAPKGAIYLGLFFLGCAANLAVRLMVADSPLDLWFSGNFSLPLGG